MKGVFSSFFIIFFIFSFNLKSTSDPNIIKKVIKIYDTLEAYNLDKPIKVYKSEEEYNRDVNIKNNIDLIKVIYTYNKLDYKKSRKDEIIPDRYFKEYIKQKIINGQISEKDAKEIILNKFKNYIAKNQNKGNSKKEKDKYSENKSQKKLSKEMSGKIKRRHKREVERIIKSGGYYQPDSYRNNAIPNYSYLMNLTRKNRYNSPLMIKNNQINRTNIQAASQSSILADANSSVENAGNSLQRTEEVITTEVNNLNQYTRFGDWGLDYDKNGNLIQKGTQRFYYDYRNQMVRSTDEGLEVKYNYNTLGRRIEKVVNGDPLKSRKYYYEGFRVIEERDGNDKLLRQYIYGNGIDEIIRMDVYNAEGTAIENSYYYHTNSIGSITAITDNNGDIIERYSYDLYGMPTITDSNN